MAAAFGTVRRDGAVSNLNGGAHLVATTIAGVNLDILAFSMPSGTAPLTGKVLTSDVNGIGTWETAPTPSPPTTTIQTVDLAPDVGSHTSIGARLVKNGTSVRLYGSMFSADKSMQLGENQNLLFDVMPEAYRPAVDALNAVLVRGHQDRDGTAFANDTFPVKTANVTSAGQIVLNGSMGTGGNFMTRIDVSGEWIVPA